MAVAWKMISTQPTDQITVTGTTKTSQVVRIAHFWQLPHVWDFANQPPLDYNDIRMGSDDPLINDYMEVLYTNPMTGPTYSELANHAFYQWFIGDLVPM
jgi:hypothetical protein